MKKEEEAWIYIQETHHLIGPFENGDEAKLYLFSFTPGKYQKNYGVVVTDPENRYINCIRSQPLGSTNAYKDMINEVSKMADTLELMNQSEDVSRKEIAELMLITFKKFKQLKERLTEKENVDEDLKVQFNSLRQRLSVSLNLERKRTDDQSRKEDS